MSPCHVKACTRPPVSSAHYTQTYLYIGLGLGLKNASLKSIPACMRPSIWCPRHTSVPAHYRQPKTNERTDEQDSLCSLLVQPSNKMCRQLTGFMLRRMMPVRVWNLMSVVRSLLGDLWPFDSSSSMITTSSSSALLSRYFCTFCNLLQQTQFTDHDGHTSCMLYKVSLQKQNPRTYLCVTARVLHPTQHIISHNKNPKKILLSSTLTHNQCNVCKSLLYDFNCFRCDSAQVS